MNLEHILDSTIGLKLSSPLSLDVEHMYSASFKYSLLIYTSNFTRFKYLIFNKRADVKWYQIGVFDKEWNLLPFVTRYKILKVKYLSRVKFDVYISDEYLDNAEYICSTSKLRGNDNFKPIVESRICSRFK